MKSGSSTHLIGKVSGWDDVVFQPDVDFGKLSEFFRRTGNDEAANELTARELTTPSRHTPPKDPVEKEMKECLSSWSVVDGKAAFYTYWKAAPKFGFNERGTDTILKNIMSVEKLTGASFRGELLRREVSTE